MTNYKIRRLTNNDYTGYFPLINEFRSTIFTEEQFIFFMDTLPSNIEIWVIVQEDNKFIATGTIIYENKLIYDICTYAHIEDICVAENCRKTGIGSILIKHLWKEAEMKKCFKITLVCKKETVPFYVKNGFEERDIQCSQLIFKDT